jgi:hypothetical protein
MSSEENPMRRGRKSREETIKMVFDDVNVRIERDTFNWIVTYKATNKKGYFGNLSAAFSRIMDHKFTEQSYKDAQEIVCHIMKLEAYKADMIKAIDLAIKKDLPVEEAA